MSIHPSYFREIHKGELVWMLANGPSLLEWTVEDFEELGGITLGINKSWKGREANEHGPAHPGITEVDYHCFVSGNNIDELLGGLVKIRRCAFVPADLRWAMMRTESRYKGKWCAIERKAGSNPGAFRDDVEYGFDANFSGYFACQLAAFMDFHTIMMVGYDCNDRQGHHWDKDPHHGVITRHQMIPWYAAFYDWVKVRKDVTVINCSPGSAIEFFPKMGKEEVKKWIRQRQRQVVQEAV